MTVINKSYFSLICGGGRGRYSKVQKAARDQRQHWKAIFSEVEGLTVQQALTKLMMFSEADLYGMFDVDANGLIISVKELTNVESIAGALRRHEKYGSRYRK